VGEVKKGAFCLPPDPPRLPAMLPEEADFRFSYNIFIVLVTIASNKYVMTPPCLVPNLGQPTIITEL
jgi:hypothetical protein